jgi:nucleoside phosphorylase
MTYFICAFKGEARSFIEKRGLKYISGFSHPLYKNSDTLLVITGIGHQNASRATEKLMQYRLPEKNDTIVNIGVCAAPEHYRIGSVLIAKEIRYKKQGLPAKTAFSHPFEEVVLRSVDEIQNHPCSTPVDMEAFGIFSTASAYVDPGQILFIKIVSDHFKPGSISIKEIINLVALKSKKIEEFLSSLKQADHF